ncbi:FHA domain-containing protein [Halioxenophilus sp. WMMB6]|uniref:FHA domain-containing protein n=1 Tax=Halioxenophilus sp. WMMB6 TaxID=3073815 RepID=UPI00295EFB99|nr:FHA domain-containing protein [Halioxenophilus sp. WMMB6]
MLKLRISGDSKSGIWLVEPKITVGRAASNNLVITDPEVDDCHIEIFAKGEELIIHRRSDKPSLVNGKKLGVKARINVNDEIIIGNTRLEVVDPKAERAQSAPVAPQQGSEWSLLPVQTGLSRNRYPLADGTVIGRSKECDIVILLAHLSRRHAQFRLLANNRLEITDLNSSNGTFVNGKQITTAFLNHGDEVRFDTLSFTVAGPKELSLPKEDSDRTVMRPMANVELKSALAEKMKNSPQPRIKSLRATAAPEPNNSAAAKSGNGVVLTLLGLIAAVVIVGLVIWLLTQ